MMSELFEKLPERGDAEKPEMVFFFDEAHLLFSDAPKVLVQKIEQVVKLIRSKGVGIYFISQRTFRTACLRSFQTACSMRSGHIRQANRRL